MRVKFKYNGVCRVGTLVGSTEGVSDPKRGETTSARPLNLTIQIDGQAHVQSFRAADCLEFRSVEFDSQIVGPLVRSFAINSDDPKLQVMGMLSILCQQDRKKDSKKDSKQAKS